MKPLYYWYRFKAEMLHMKHFCITFWQRFLAFWGKKQKLEKSFFEKEWDRIQEEKKNPLLREARLRREQEDFERDMEWRMQKSRDWIFPIPRL